MIELSIIIPVYNTAHLVSSCLNSIYDQSNFNFNFEVITVNDGSKDNSLQVLNQFKKIHNNLIVLSQDNSGTGAARNLGISKSKGKYIWFIDSDDFIEENAFSIIQKNCFENTLDEVTLGFNYIKVNGKNKIFVDEHSNHNDFEFFKGVEYIKASSKKPYFLWVLIFNKSIIDRYNIRFISNIKNLEDLDFSIKYFSHCNDVLYVNERLYNYYENDLSTSRNLSLENLLKIANDTFIVHKSIRKTIENTVDIKSKIIINEVLNKSIIGFFYSLFKFKYSYVNLKTYYFLYLKEALLPTKIKERNFKFYIFEKFVNNRFVFLPIAYLKKFTLK